MSAPSIAVRKSFGQNIRVSFSERQRESGAQALRRELGAQALRRELGAQALRRELGAQALRRELGAQALRRELGAQALRRRRKGDKGESEKWNKDYGCGSRSDLCSGRMLCGLGTSYQR